MNFSVNLERAPIGLPAGLPDSPCFHAGRKFLFAMVSSP